MDTVVEQLKDRMVGLSAGERAELAYFLLSSLDSDEVEIATAWDAEAERRVGEIHSGAPSAVPSKISSTSFASAIREAHDDPRSSRGRGAGGRRVLRRPTQ